MVLVLAGRNYRETKIMKILCMVCQIDDLSRFRGQANRVTDQWAPARTEGRSAINCGFGFGLLGHQVDIMSNTFENKQVNENVRLINTYPADAYYDIVYSVRTHIYRGNCGRQFNSITHENHNPKFAAQMKKDFPSMEFFGNVSLITNMYQKPGMQVDPRVLPFLYPIPCLPGLDKQGFVPYHWDKNKKEQKIWIYNGRLPYNGFQTALTILRHLRDHYKYNLKVYKFTNTLPSHGWSGVVPAEADILREFNVTSIEADKQSYFDVVTTLQQMDMCLTFGDPCYPGAGAWDMISLGKLFFYSTIQSWVPYGINEMFRLPWSFSGYDLDSAVKEKVNKIISNPKQCVDDFQNSIAYYSYPNWKPLMEKILAEKHKGT